MTFSLSSNIFYSTYDLSSLSSFFEFVDLFFVSMKVVSHKYLHYCYSCDLKRLISNVFANDLDNSNDALDQSFSFVRLKQEFLYASGKQNV